MHTFVEVFLSEQQNETTIRIRIRVVASHSGGTNQHLSHRLLTRRIKAVNL